MSLGLENGEKTAMTPSAFIYFSLQTGNVVRALERRKDCHDTQYMYYYSRQTGNVVRALRTANGNSANQTGPAKADTVQSAQWRLLGLFRPLKVIKHGSAIW